MASTLQLSARRGLEIGIATALAIASLMPLASSRANAGDKPRDPTAIKEEMDKLREKMAALEAEATKAEMAAQAATEVEQLREQAHDRLTTERDELKELEKPVEGEPLTPARKAQREGRISHLRTAIKIDEAIAAMKGAEALPKAREQMREREIIEAKWNLVTQPVTDRAIRLEDLTHAAREAKKTPETLTVAQKLHEADAKDADAEFNLRQKRMRAEVEMSRLLEQTEKQLAGQ